MRNGRVSFWWSDDVGRAARAAAPDRPPLSGDVEADVAVVGAGYTGLWTAYHLARAEPGLRVRVVEARHVGYGASGRNGGWLTSAIAGERGRLAAARGEDAVRALHTAMVGAVDAVTRTVEEEGIDARLERGGVLTVARNPAQAARLPGVLAEEHRFGDTDAVLLDRDAAQAVVRVEGGAGAVHSPHTARVHPVGLVTGLAAAAERHGVVVHEGSPVTSIAAGEVRTARGRLRARHVLRCTEGFTARFAGARRALLPVNSSLVATEPLPDRTWDEIGWPEGVVVGDLAHAYMYAQRTPDGRIALGGRGVPYRFGSRTDTDGATGRATVDQLRATLHAMFPAVRDVPLAHVWSGVLGVPRDWCASVEHDPVTGLGHAGGYTGHGVAAANLAGRTLCDLVLGRESDLVGLPHVGWRSPAWEPEPLRWLGVRGLYLAYRAADRSEQRSGSARTSVVGRVGDRISGRHG